MQGVGEGFGVDIVVRFSMKSWLGRSVDRREDYPCVASTLIRSCLRCGSQNLQERAKLKCAEISADTHGKKH